MSAKSLLKLALSFCYFAEYGILITLMAMAGKEHTAFDQILIYFVYSIPPLILLFLRRYVAFLTDRALATAIAVLLISVVNSVFIGVQANDKFILISTFIFSLAKSVTKICCYSHIQSSYQEREQSKILSDLVALRFTLMIGGASLAGFICSRYSVESSYLLHALIMLISTVIFFIYRKRFLSIAKRVHAQGFTPTSIALGIKELIRLYGFPLFLSVCVYFFSVGAFMSIEYPLLTRDLSIPTALIGFTYLGHIFGALGARKMSHVIFSNASTSTLNAIKFNSLMPIAFAFVGIGFSGLVAVSVQLGIVAFVMTLSEMIFEGLLMRQGSSSIYPQLALSIQALNGIANLWGSAFSLTIPRNLSILRFNILTQAMLLAILGITLGVHYFLKRRTTSLAGASERSG